MSKLDNIILDCVNKALDGKEEKLGDYIDPTVYQVKQLFSVMLEDYTGHTNDGDEIVKMIREDLEKL